VPTAAAAAVAAAPRSNYRDEEDIQAGIAAVLAPRDDVFLETKIPCGSTYTQASAALESNLQQLGVEWVDLTLIHSPCSSRSGGLNGNAETWRALEDFQKCVHLSTASGGAGRGGVSPGYAGRWHATRPAGPHRPAPPMMMITCMRAHTIMPHY
jgi:hypothetical protein